MKSDYGYWLTFGFAVLSLIIRLPYLPQHFSSKTLFSRRTVFDLLLMRLVFFFMFIFPMLNWQWGFLSSFDYELSPSRFYIGSVLLVLTILLFWKTHLDLGRNWSPSLDIKEEHQLISHGIYRFVRHPMYASFILWGVSHAVVIPNSITGTLGLVAALALYLTRFRKEERMLEKQFGATYVEYCQRTQRLLPFLL